MNLVRKTTLFIAIATSSDMSSAAMAQDDRPAWNSGANSGMAPDQITLERIGAVRMASPDEVAASAKAVNASGAEAQSTFSAPSQSQSIGPLAQPVN
jgi:hypothetical protein